jgi:magnesium chelatase subunit I
MIFPFTPIVGQEEMKTGLILNVIDPSIGGLLIMGEKGTAKSTAVRALAELLPEIEAVKGCPFNCDPEGLLCGGCQEVIRQGEDRLVGTLDVEYAIKKGEKRFEPGILAAANRNFLYVDEVNLLEDHIVDLLLDSAAMGVNTVEREGVSFTHPARFILVGTMNPEEGDLRPQLLDRFGLCARVTTIQDKTQRIEILRRRAAFDSDPEGFLRNWQDEQANLSARIVAAKEKLNGLEITEGILEKIVEITSQLSLDGHRADIVILKAARALTAFRSGDNLGPMEIRDSAQLALSHRLKRAPFEEISSGNQRLDSILLGLTS